MAVDQEIIDKMNEEIHYCQYCQPRDPEEYDGFFWILGDRIEFRSYLDNIGVPEEEQEELANDYRCPYCGTYLSIDDDIGLKTEYEIRFDEKIAEIVTDIEPQIRDFSEYIEKYPYLGCKHEIGRKICDEIDSLERLHLDRENWFRARKISNDIILNNEDMLPPNKKTIIVNEGRFNHYGQSHFYLGDSKDLCAIEVSTENSICWMQEFLITANNIIDLSIYLNPENIDTLPLTFAGIMVTNELRKEVRRNDNWKPEYFVSRYIADICKEVGINGIKYASSKYRGDNLVIFNIENIDYSFSGQPDIFKKNIRNDFADIMNLI